jgi:transposase
MKVYIGIDWSQDKHDIVVLNEAGAQLAYLCIPNKLEGFMQFDTQRAKLGLKPNACVIGIETSHSLLVDYLVEQNYPTLYVLPPNQVRANQGRFRQSGAKDDPADARLIAEILRTDRGRLRQWQADRLLTRQMRNQVRWILELQHQIVRLSNQLEALLRRYYPAALEIFRTGLTTQILPEFILAYADPYIAKELTLDAFKAFAKQHDYPNPKNLVACFQRLQDNPPLANPDLVILYQVQAQQLAHLLLETTRTRIKNQIELRQRYLQHPKHAIFDTLPGCGDLIGPALLAFFGDDPDRFPDAQSAQSMAGTAPVTERSGKSRFVRFRFACDKDWRYICQEWAHILIQHELSPIATAYYHQIRPHCHSTAHAERCLANRWLAIAWKCWQSGRPYDPAYHLAQRAERSKPR